MTTPKVGTSYLKLTIPLQGLPSYFKNKTAPCCDRSKYGLFRAASTLVVRVRSVCMQLVGAVTHRRKASCVCIHTAVAIFCHFAICGINYTLSVFRLLTIGCTYYEKFVFQSVCSVPSDPSVKLSFAFLRVICIKESCATKDRIVPQSTRALVREYSGLKRHVN